MQNFKKLLFLLSAQEQKSAGLLSIMIIIMALLDMVGVASILPFMAVLTDPSLVETNYFLTIIFQKSKIFGVETTKQFLILLGFLVFILLVISVSFKALTIYIQVRFVQMSEFSICRRLVDGYLNQPYSWFLSRHSADLGKIILSEVQQVTANGLSPMIELIAKSMITIALITLLLIVDPKLTLIVGSSLGVIYLIIFYLVRNYLTRIGKLRLEKNQKRFTIVSEAFGAVKEIKVGSLEEKFIKTFSESAKIFARTQASSQLISQLPRFILEVVAFGGILLLIIYIMTKTNNLNTALPILSLYVFTGYRLMPALQQIYLSFTKLSFVGPSLDKLHDDLENLKLTEKNQSKDTLTFKNAITLKNIHYYYPNTLKTTLNDISLKIPSKSTVALVGSTGSGKTTTINIILGLLEPYKGTFEVDEKVITKKNIKSWQKLIGYVPQNIYLLDDTVSANIAFGVSTRDVNQDRIEEVAKIAKLHEFITKEFPKKYQTKIGERGIRLSGGQIQRIGIARALYKNPQVLIFDEATSSLDMLTEKAVMESINNIAKDLTVILVAHRLNTLKNCDIIFKFDKGQLIKQGTFDEVIRSDKELYRYWKRK